MCWDEEVPAHPGLLRGGSKETPWLQGGSLVAPRAPRDDFGSDAPNPDLLKLLLSCFRWANGKRLDEGTI